jgi:hypothetical protein
MTEDQILIDYSPPTWREWLFEVLDFGFEYLLLFALFPVLGALTGGHVYQSPLGPLPSAFLVNLGFMLTSLQIALGLLLSGIVEVVTAWALWLTPARALACGLAVGFALWLWR